MADLQSRNFGGIDVGSHEIGLKTSGPFLTLDFCIKSLDTFQQLSGVKWENSLMTERGFLWSCGNRSSVLNVILFLKNMYFHLHTWICGVQFPLL